jgi:RHS repeat-associated protein
MNAEPIVELAEYNYNELGQLVKKYLHGNSSSHLQGIDYRYNIRGWLTSINNAMLDDVGVLNDDIDDAFGEELSYNNSFKAGTTEGTDQWNGNISGMKWKSKAPSTTGSSIEVSAYAFKYDKLNRMTLAGYGSGSNSTLLTLKADHYNEQLTYDEMGNIKTLKRNSGGASLDDLVYDYKNGVNSNTLLAVTDNSSNAGGFNDVNKPIDDYTYDGNGNLTTDNNKGLAITYNFLNLPQSVTKGAQSIGYTYDATGKKLAKKFTGQPDHYYIDGIEFDGPTLLFAMTEEGRVRKASTGSYTYDYFLKDHLGNIRVVLSTDGSQPASIYPAASMEPAMAATETIYYSNLDKVRNFTPVGFTSLKKNEKVAHLKGTDPNKQIGPSITVKVNSGDKVSLIAQSFYPDNSGTQRTGLAETALSQLVNAMINPTGLNANGKAIATERLKAQGFEGDAGYRDMMNKLPNSDYANENDRPKAFMVWMLFDNEMKLVKSGKSSGARQIPEGAGQVKQMAENEIVMDQGGFLTAYTVNESPASVYIDNFQLSVATGPVLEMNNYYPFGMLNEGLSDPGITDPINNYKYNEKELQKDLSLNWLDYGARFYDPQIGRWHSMDPLAEISRRWSPYNYVRNNPIRNIDPDGMMHTDANGNETADSPEEAQSEYQKYYNKYGKKNEYNDYNNPTDGDPPQTQNDNSIGRMSLSPQGLDFIQKHEGFGKGPDHENPYNDTRKFATAGYGHLIHTSEVNDIDVSKYKGITEAQALILLFQDLQSRVAAVNKLVKVSLTQYQFDAIVSFTFNVGIGTIRPRAGLKGSLFLNELNKGNYDGNFMMNYCKPSSLIGRRKDEVNLFMTGKY